MTQMIPESEKTLSQKVVTYDLARQMEGAKKVRCSEFVRNLMIFSVYRIMHSLSFGIFGILS